MASRFKALDEFPYLTSTRISDDPLEKELWDYDTLRGLHEVSSELIKNNAIAASFAMAHVNAFMGGGIQTTIEGSDYITKPLKELFSLEPTFDINKLYSLDMLMEYVVFMTFKKGDVLIHTPYVKDRGEIGTCVELIDAGRIRTPLTKTSDSNIRNGVKYSAGGRIEGYYVVPIEAVMQKMSYTDYDFIPLYTKGKFGLVKQNCLLNKSPLFDEFGSARSYPPLVPSSRLLRYTDKYVEAVVIGANVAACFAGFITTSNPAGSKKSFDQNDRKLKQIGKMSPGGLYFLRKGEDISFGSPSRPADNTDSFIKRLTLMCSASIRWPYEMAQLHLENTSFSSWKGGATEISQNQNRWVARLRTACNFIMKNIYQEAVVKGMVKYSDKTKFKFEFPKFNPLDPEKKARADNVNLNNKVTSLHKVYSESNENYENIQAQIEKEAMDVLERQARLVLKTNELEDTLDITLFSEGEDEEKKKSTKREGETVGTLTEDEKKERRKADGNF